MRTLLASITVTLAMSAFAEAADTASTPRAEVAPSAVRAYQAKSPTLNRAELDALLAKPEQVLVIDVRRPDELTANGGLPVYLSVQSKDLESSRAFIPRERIIVTVSNHAGRAGAAADFLAAHGFNVAGAVGVLDYEAEGGTLTKVAPSPPRSPVEAEKR
jgi:rhodanese-related sulfurtransferase